MAEKSRSAPCIVRPRAIEDLCPRTRNLKLALLAAALLFAAAVLTGCSLSSYSGIPAAVRDRRLEALPISGSGMTPRLQEAPARLGAGEARKTRAVTANVFRGISSEPELAGTLAEAFETLVRIELYSDRCFHVQQNGEDIDRYSDVAWHCIMSSELPKDCRRSSDAVLRTVRFIRFNPGFTLLHGAAREIIDRCVAKQQRSINNVYASRRRANFLDLAIARLGYATRAQNDLINAYTRSYEAHGPSLAPVLPFSEAMCRRLVSGETLSPASFWILFCSAENTGLSGRAQGIV